MAIARREHRDFLVSVPEKVEEDTALPPLTSSPAPLHHSGSAYFFLLLLLLLNFCATVSTSSLFHFPKKKISTFAIYTVLSGSLYVGILNATLMDW